MTTAQNPTAAQWATIDKLAVTLLAWQESGDDDQDKIAIISNYSALQRKLRSARVDPHTISLQPKSNQSGLLANMTRLHADEQAAHANTRAALKKAEEALKAAKKAKAAPAPSIDAEAPTDVLEAITAALVADRTRRDSKAAGEVERLSRENAALTTKLAGLRERVGALLEDA